MDLEALLTAYRTGLLDDVLPFWTQHAIDREHGGFCFFLDRDGTRLDDDKGMWQHGRFTWLLATLYNEVEARPEWLDLARHGIEFMRKHAFDTDGRMFFHLTRDGRPIRKRRYVFTESFAAIAFAAYAKAAQDDRARDEATRLFELVHRHFTTPGLTPSKFAETRPTKSIGAPMILLATAQVIRATIGHPASDARIDRCIDEIERDFVRPELEAVLETCGPNGELIEHSEGRTLNPGHAIEAAWFLLEEARHRGGDARLVRLGTTILDWMWRRGWDAEHGGLLYFVDLHGGPVHEYWHDMKFWWPHNEAVLATLLAFEATGAAKYADWHRRVHDWAHDHFPDREQGEWFGYLHRDGSISSRAKGNLWKGPFHIPRMQLVAWQICERLLKNSS